ncbi:unnamed protein product [Lactuca virosa]|uniref:Uncharacterized protein n=1 Tax=Lactuca virosa TaxID=75947 RepID=A0AAU9MWM8_9ASTR|nr:unnamed protein product [Lactuca virosa]
MSTLKKFQNDDGDLDIYLFKSLSKWSLPFSISYLLLLAGWRKTMYVMFWQPKLPLDSFWPIGCKPATHSHQQNRKKGKSTDGCFFLLPPTSTTVFHSSASHHQHDFFIQICIVIDGEALSLLHGEILL